VCLCLQMCAFERTGCVAVRGVYCVFVFADVCS
jgi:hypothetical protein